MRALPAPSLILDGEAIALRADGRPHPFQVTMRRFGRKLDVEALRGELPLSVFFFDCLLRDGEPLVDRPARASATTLLRAALPPSIVTPSLDHGGRGSRRRRSTPTRWRSGHEGVMAKALDAPYEAGRRGAGWLKVKRAHTLDLVVLAAEWGSGRRKGWLSNLHLGARDPASGGFVMLGKTFKGLTDEMLEWQTQRAARARDRAATTWTVHVRPELVVEIAFNDVQESPHYPGGLALRFARVKGYRPDKRPEEADTIDTVRAHLREKPGMKTPRRLAAPTSSGSTRRPIALGLERVARGSRRGWSPSSHCPVITVGGTNGKGSTCAMLESILRAGGLPHRPLHLAASAALQRARAHRAASKPPTTRCAEASRRWRRRAADVPLTYFEFGTLAALLAFRAEQDRGGDPRGRPRRPARRGQRRRRRLRGADQRRHRPRRLPRRRPRDRSAARRPASSAPAARRSSPSRDPPQSVLDARRATSCCSGKDFGFSRSEGQWTYWGPRGRRARARAIRRCAARIQLRNAAAALCALDALRELPVAMQDVRRGLAEVDAARRASRCCPAARR